MSIYREWLLTHL